ncbi:hypothetical protein [Cupriavidus pinatubonensis]|uniref:hypothetical protein n=1 Tax=Cupriavidus pinatubonensis TaxID=248026 RepID=UPI001CC7AB71|nr:hypothetical protein [Cupriavidus pinatubonensis]
MESTLCKGFRLPALQCNSLSGHAGLIGIEYQFTPASGAVSPVEMQRYLYYGALQWRCAPGRCWKKPRVVNSTGITVAQICR